MAGRGAGDSRVRGFGVGCLDGGGGGCKSLEDDVVSIDKERKGLRQDKRDVIWGRDACNVVDNMMSVRMQSAFSSRQPRGRMTDRSRDVLSQ